jgi:hypothetical protein
MENIMQSFHNDIAVKQKYVARIEAHRKADEIIRGIGWDEGKGCAVGCTLNAYNHKAYETELGIPEWLARAEDMLFEGMTEGRAMLWPSEFLMAIPLGVTEDQFERWVKAPFLVMVLECTLKNFDHTKFPECATAVRGSIALWQRKDIGSAAWSAARSAAWSAADSAAWSAARSAADSAAESAARGAAESAAESAAYDHFADELLTLLRAAKS